MKIVSTSSLTGPYLPIQLNNQAETYWWFNLNSNSSVTVAFSEVTSSSLTLTVEGGDLKTDIKTGNSEIQFFPNNKDMSRGYKMKIASSDFGDLNEIVGYLTIEIDQTSFGSTKTANNNITCSNGINCYWEFDFAEDVCISFTSTSTRDWNRESDGNCLIVSQIGYDVEWGAIIISLSVIFIILIVVGNIAVVYILNKRNEPSPAITIYS